MKIFLRYLESQRDSEIPHYRFGRRGSVFLERSLGGVVVVQPHIGNRIDNTLL